jgi:glycosyltransferase involved in cell wall biosynthesis
LLRCWGARVLIAGHDEDALAVKLRNLAEECGIGDRVLCLSGQIAGTNKEALFAAARPFALPSVSENNVVAEAMISSLPVIVTASVGVTDIVEASGGVVAPGEPKGCAAVMAHLLESNEGLAVMGDAGAAYAREQLNWNSVARRFGDLYGEISSSGGRPRWSTAG